jgi:hypothetical protein
MANIWFEVLSIFTFPRGAAVDGSSALWFCANVVNYFVSRWDKAILCVWKISQPSICNPPLVLLFTLVTWFLVRCHGPAFNVYPCHPCKAPAGFCLELVFGNKRLFQCHAEHLTIFVIFGPSFQDSLHEIVHIFFYKAARSSCIGYSGGIWNWPLR